jgi:hypothetical protein
MAGISALGEGLMFLISQPRAGSTMLQRVLASHPDIHTVSEPWIALHPLFALREHGISGDFDSALARQALQEFLRPLPDGEKQYWRAVRRMLGYLYSCALEGSGKSIFLDKTPRYYFVIPELRRVFPDARFIFLLRNPVAVLASHLDTWLKSEDIARLSHSGHDLLVAPRLIMEGIHSFGSAAIVVHYENLVSAPELEVRRLCEKLGIHFHPGMIDYGRADPTRPQWMFGDQDTVYRENRPTPARVERWRQVLERSPVWRIWAAAYLSALGAARVGGMGYDFEALRSQITAPEEEVASAARTMAAWAAGESKQGEIGLIREEREIFRADLIATRADLIDRTKRLETANSEVERLRHESRLLTSNLIAVRAELLDRTRQLGSALAELRKTGENE